MTAPLVHIEVDDRQVQAAFARLLALGHDLSPVMTRIVGAASTGVKPRDRVKRPRSARGARLARVIPPAPFRERMARCNWG